MTLVITEITDNTAKMAADLLIKGGVISFPTETVYALAADSKNDHAIERIYQLKGRDNSKPLALLAANIEQVRQMAEIDERAEILFSKYAPGPLTLILKLKKGFHISPKINNGSDTIGVRIPNHKLSLEILAEIGRPIIATSTNISGEAASINAQQVQNIFPTQLDLIIDQGACEIGISSTIIDLTTKEIKFLREGSINTKKILSLLVDP